MKTRSSLRAAGRGFLLSLQALPVSAALFTVTITAILLLPVGGFFALPALLGAVRAHAGRRRDLAAAWSGVRIEAAYLPLPEVRRGGALGVLERSAALLRDPATWRDLGWLFVDMWAGWVTAFLPLALFFSALEGIALAAGLWRVLAGDTGTYWYAFVPVDGQATALGAGALGIVVLHLAMRNGDRLLRAHFLLTKSLIGRPLTAELAQRIDRLEETRSDAVDASAAELRRIERDLHDGAQARLVAMGMHLNTIEALVEKDPALAKQLLSQARQNSAEALSELRDLVRGIHPPVLAERGLGDAVRALALRLPLPVEVDVRLPGRADAPVESAAYFAVSEALANVVKHAAADRAWVDISHADGSLRVTVTDDGTGGAAAGPGTGLAGMERRLGTFDGVLAVSSPVGGPTMVTMEIPCVLS
ncbi:sensor histidine kinase [Streptomyces sp. NPDC012888]|uniref:sensor histidine kinase n=1 Tax=Streptomyces sp. NPDC012888 TaxID=3364855 RepID=UPI00369B5110